MPRSLVLILILLASCTDATAQGSITRLPIPDGGWITHSDLSFIDNGHEEVRINQHDKRVTITRDGADAGWTCYVEGGRRAPRK